MFFFLILLKFVSIHEEHLSVIKENRIQQQINSSDFF